MKLRFAAFIPIAAILLSANAELTYTYKMTVEDSKGTYDYLCSFITSELTNATETVELGDLEIASITNLYTSRDAWAWSGQATGKNLAISSGELSFETTASLASWIYSNENFDEGNLGAKIVPPAGYVSYGFLYTVFSSLKVSENKLLSNTNKLTIAQIKNTGYPQYHIVPLIRPAREFWFVDPVANTTNVIAAVGTEEEGDDGPIGVNLPTPEAKSGYEFQHWETEAGASLADQDYYNPAFTLGSASTPVIVKAKFKQLPWTITVDANGGTGTMAAQEYYQGNSFTLKANAFTKTGYSFGGWALSATGGKVYDNNASIAANDENMTTNKTLYAKWTANNYSLILYANNGTAASSSQAMVYDTEASITKFDDLDFPKTGYSFAGWGTQATSTTIDYADEAVVSNLVTTAGGSIGLYCVWTANVYKVTFNNGSGSGGTASVDATYDSAMPSIDILPTRTGYTFEGYYTSTYGAGTRYYYASGSSARRWDKTSATTLYANWSANKYTVTLDKQGGSGGPDSVTATYNSELPTVTTPTRTGYTFGGYFTGENGGTQYYSSAGASVRNWTLTYNTTLYAKWTAKTSTVTFDQQDGSGGTTTVTATYDSAMPSITIPTRTGYTFGGYFTNTGGYGTQYYNADGTSAQNLDKTDTSITLYAKWTANTYTVTLDQQGGSGGTASVTATYASPMPTAEMPTRDGYAFGGYYTEPDDGGTQYYKANGTSAQAWYLTDDTTLYAKWGEITYTLRLLPNDGTGSSVSANLTYDEEYTLPTVATLGYTKTGYRFNGWGDASDSTTARYADGATVSNLTSTAGNTVNLYAIWGERTYTVTFDANGGEIDDGDSTREYTYNSTYGSLPVPSRTGYTFTGWKNGDNSITGDMTCTLADDATFTAGWAPINYVIAFDANGGTGEMDAINAVYDEEVTLPASTFESPGTLLRFAGWSESETAPETPDVEIAYADKAVVSNLVTEAGATNTLYAVWRYPDMNYALENFDLEFEVPNLYTDKVTINTEDCFVEATDGGRFTTILTNAEGMLSFNWDTTGNGSVRINTYSSGGGAQTNLRVYTPDASEYAIELSTNIAVIVYWRANDGTGKTIKVSKVKWTPAGDEPVPAGDEPTDEDAPDISSLSVADGVKFTSDARFNYEIWYKTDLSSKTDWKLLTTIEGTGGEVGFELIQPGEDVMFYEIKVVGK